MRWTARLLLLLLGAASADDSASLIPQARALANKGDAAGADELLVQASQLAPDDPQPLLLRGNIAAFLQRKHAEGAAFFHQSIALRPTFEAHFFLGKVS